MNRTVLIGLASCSLALMTPSAAWAQTLNGANNPQIYRLSNTASYQYGCFEPCLCPIQSPLEMRGTMTLGSKQVGDAFDFRAITDIRWYVSDLNGNDVHTLTGSGSYFISNFGAPPVHGLELDLQIDGGEVTHFFSELEPVESNDASFAIQVSINGLYCLDTVLQVNAAAVPLNQITNYTVRNDATYQQGCWDPCDCPLWSPVPMVGNFKLVELRNFGTYVEYAVVSMHLSAFSDNNDTSDDVMLDGGGLYTLIAGFAGMIESMELDLSVNGEPETHFSSGYLNSGEEFPAIDIDVNMNGLVCFDILLHISAQHRPTRWNAVNVSDAQEIAPPMAPTR